MERIYAPKYLLLSLIIFFLLLIACLILDNYIGLRINLLTMNYTNDSYVKFEDLPISLRESDVQPYLSILDQTMPPFLPNYKTPCWREESDAVHRNIQLNCLPYLYVAGMSHSGTTDLSKQIMKHPLIVKHKTKENHYWSKERVGIHDEKPVGHTLRSFTDDLRSAIKTVEAYSIPDDRYADGYHPKVLAAEAPSTLFLQKFWKILPENKNTIQNGPVYHNGHHIYHVTPQAHIIVIFRHPTQRAYSTYAIGNKPGSRFADSDFHQIMYMGIEILQNCTNYETLWGCVNRDFHNNAVTLLQQSIYYAYVEQWLKVFPRNQMYFVKLEEYSKNRIPILNDLFSFLGLDPVPVDLENGIREARPHHSHLHVKTMSLETLDMLNKFFKPYNEKLADFLQDKKWLFID